MRRFLALVLASGALLGIGVSSVSATRPSPDHKVTICHRTNSDTNPYVRITVDIASSGYVKKGHNTHNGPIYNPTLKDQHIKWGDIIPPYTYGNFSYSGKNWPDGEAIYNNGCKILSSPTPTPTVTPTPEVTPTPTPEVTPTPENSESPTPIVTPTPNNEETPPPTDTMVESASVANPSVLGPLMLIFAFGVPVLAYALRKR